MMLVNATINRASLVGQEGLRHDPRHHSLRPAVPRCCVFLIPGRHFRFHKKSTRQIAACFFVTTRWSWLPKLQCF
jgi:hypothetical protein